MQTVAGMVVIALSALAWIGQTMVWFSPSTASRLGLAETETEVEPAFWADVIGEARWDALTLWTMLAAGVLMILNQPSWPYFGLVGGGTYLYFGGRGISTRLVMRQRGLRIGSARTLPLVLSFLVAWTMLGLAMIAASATALGR